MNEKIEQDAASYVRAIAERRQRNIRWVQDAVLHSVSLTANEALDSNVVDIVAESMQDLLDQMDGQVVQLPAGPDTLETADSDTREVELTWRDRVLKVITSPEIAYILLSIGGFGIMMELYHPGTFIPGTIGAICLIVGFYGLQQLPLNYAGLALILLAFILFALEIKVISHGVLTIGGVISMLIGSLMLIDSSEPYMKISLSVILAVVGVTAAFFALAAYFAIRTFRTKPTTGDVGLVGQLGTVKERLAPYGLVYVAGEYWKGHSDVPLEPGERVKVVALDNMVLKVEKVE
jgi:membrane-bound serine protease (ClpP class)